MYLLSSWFICSSDVFRHESDRCCSLSFILTLLVPSGHAATYLKRATGRPHRLALFISWVPVPLSSAYAQAFIILFFTPLEMEFSTPCKRKHLAFRNPLLYSIILGILTVNFIVRLSYKFALKIDMISRGLRVTVLRKYNWLSLYFN